MTVDVYSGNELRSVVFHSLRHSSTSIKLQISCGNIKAVQGDTGHAQARMVTESICAYEQRRAAASGTEGG